MADEKEGRRLGAATADLQVGALPEPGLSELSTHVQSRTESGLHHATVADGLGRILLAGAAALCWPWVGSSAPR